MRLSDCLGNSSSIEWFLIMNNIGTYRYFVYYNAIWLGSHIELLAAIFCNIERV